MKVNYWSEKVKLPDFGRAKTLVQGQKSKTA
jgi:hypothetical protein